MFRTTMTYMKFYLTKYIRNEKGQTMVEYGLLLFFIALAVIAILTTLGPKIAGVFEDIDAAIP